MKEKVFVCDAYEAGFEIEPVSTESGEEDFKDLKLTRIGNNYKEIDATSLFAVNGLVYPSIVAGDGIYLKGARDDRGQRVFIIRTNKIGELQKTILTPNDVTNPNDIDLRDEQAVYLKSNFNLLEKSFFLILNGYLFLNDERIQIVDAGLLSIDQISLDLDKRFLLANCLFNRDRKNELKFNDLTLDRKLFYDFDTFKSIIGNGNSFFAYFDKKVQFSKIPIASHNTPGKYYSVGIANNELLLSREGRVLDYKYSEGKWNEFIESSSLINNLPRSATTDNIDVTSVANSLPYSNFFDDVFIADVYIS